MNPKPPPEFTRIPLRLLKAPALAKLERTYYHLLKTLDALRKTLPEVTAEYERAGHCWEALRQESQRRLLVAAQREEVLWTVFTPHSYGTVETSRTRRYHITYFWHNVYPLWSAPYHVRDGGYAYKAFGWIDPWTDCGRVLAERSGTPVACAA